MWVCPNMEDTKCRCASSNHSCLKLEIGNKKLETKTEVKNLKRKDWFLLKPKKCVEFIVRSVPCHVPCHVPGHGPKYPSGRVWTFWAMRPIPGRMGCCTSADFFGLTKISCAPATATQTSHVTSPFWWFWGVDIHRLPWLSEKSYDPCVCLCGTNWQICVWHRVARLGSVHRIDFQKLGSPSQGMVKKWMLLWMLVKSCTTCWNPIIRCLPPFSTGDSDDSLAHPPY